jgi:YD repeat-containing protein
MAHRWAKLAGTCAAIFVAAAAADAQGATTYTYDALGRLVKVERPDGGTTEYTYDNAGNRLNVTVTGSSSCANGNAIWGTGTYGCFRWASNSCVNATAIWGTGTYGCFRWGQ